MSDRQILASKPWPSVGHETRPWERDIDAVASRTERRRHVGPYEAAVPAEIARCQLTLPGETAALVEEAAAEVARFDAELGREIAPFASVLLRTESAASSKIENLTASARAIAQAELLPGRSRNASLIVANERAMTAAIKLAARIDGDAILAMHTALLEHSDPDIAGRWREQQVWIGGGDLGPHGALFVPPHHDLVRSAIADLVAFIDRDDVPVLAHTAVAHAQFETIHPFPDGNGRTGRALVQAHLRNKGLTRNVTVPVSAGLLADTDAYFEALNRYRAGEIISITEQFARAAFAAIDNARRLTDELHAIRVGWDDQIKARRHAAAWRIADLLIRRPVLNAPAIAAELGINPRNVYRTIEPLLRAGAVIEFSAKKGHRMWRAPQVLEALDQFGVRAGRRNRASH